MSVLFYCRNCGGTNLINKGEYYHCRECGSRALMATENRKIEEEMRLIADEQKREHVQNLRRQLYERVHAEYINSTEIRGICHEIRNYLPDDFCARFYEVANGESEAVYAEFLRTVDVAENSVFIKEIVTFTVRSLRTSLVLPLKNLVECAFKQQDFALYRDLTSAIEEEAERVDSCIYETYIPRDVFVLYSSKDMERVLELVEVLEGQGLTCFVAMRNLQHGRGAVENYQKLLQTAIDSCATVVLVSSVHSRSVSCDAFKIEMPYIQRTAPVSQKARIEYRIDDLRSTPAVNNYIKTFFKDKEYCTLPEQVAERVLEHLLRSHAEATDESTAVPEKRAAVKYCKVCGAENAQSANYCSECAGAVFQSTRTTDERQTCPACKSLIDPEARFCPVCGYAVATAVGNAAEREAEQTAKTQETEPRERPEARKEETVSSAPQQACTTDTDSKIESLLQEAERLNGQKEYGKAFEVYRSAAILGSAEAEYALGEAYANGRGTEVRYESALEWYRMAAEKGHDKAQFALGEMYARGISVRINDRTALKWYQKSAEQGNVHAMIAVSEFYQYGRGVKQDTNRAMELLRAAADTGQPLAQHRLGSEYEILGAVDDDDELYARAVECYRMAANQNYPAALSALGYCYARAVGVPQDWSIAVELYTRACELGDAHGAYLLACCYENGDGVEKDDARALAYYQLAAKGGDSGAQCALGHRYLDGTGVKKDPLLATSLFRMAADQDSVEAQCALGDCFLNGMGVPRDYDEAVKWLSKAADENDTEAKYRLGYCYEHGYGVSRDKGRAVELYLTAAKEGYTPAIDALTVVQKSCGAEILQKSYSLIRDAAAQGVASAQVCMGDFFREGRGGLQKNAYRAFGYYMQAARQGVAAAQRRVGDYYLNGIAGAVAKTPKEAVKWYGEAAKQHDLDAHFALGKCYFLGIGVTANPGKAREHFITASNDGSNGGCLHWSSSVSSVGLFCVGSAYFADGCCILYENPEDGSLYVIKKQMISKATFKMPNVFRHGSVNLYLNNPPKGCKRQITLIDNPKSDDLCFSVLKSVLKANGISIE